MCVTSRLNTILPNVARTICLNDTAVLATDVIKVNMLRRSLTMALGGAKNLTPEYVNVRQLQANSGGASWALVIDHRPGGEV